MIGNIQTIDAVKWLATVIQLFGYGMTGLNLIPYNIYMFFIGIFLWFAVGVMWKDKAIKVVHVGAFLSLFLSAISTLRLKRYDPHTKSSSKTVIWK